MRPSILPLLRCPVTGSELTLKSARVDGEHVMEGTLCAQDPSLAYPIINGVPRLLPPTSTCSRTRSAFSFQWSRRLAGIEPSNVLYGHPLDAATEFMERSVLPPAGSGSGWVLDAGCGTAERSAALAERGHAVIAFDLSDSVDAAFRRFGHVPRLQLIQGDVLHPPIASSAMDVIICIGVLHHTPDTRAGFRTMTGLLRPGGRILLWLYPRERREVDPFLGKLYRLRDALRVAHKLPPRAVWAISLAASAALYPFYASRFRQLQKGRATRARDVLGSIVMNTFDFLAPPFQSRHDAGEVARWFGDEGYPAPTRAGTGFYYATKFPMRPRARAGEHLKDPLKDSAWIDLQSCTP